MCLFQGDLMKPWLKKEGNVLKISCSFLPISLLSITANSWKSFLRLVSICRSICFLPTWLKCSADSAWLYKPWNDSGACEGTGSFPFTLEIWLKRNPMPPLYKVDSFTGTSGEGIWISFYWMMSKTRDDKFQWEVIKILSLFLYF